MQLIKKYNRQLIIQLKNLLKKKHYCKEILCATPLKYVKMSRRVS